MSMDDKKFKLQEAVNNGFEFRLGHYLGGAFSIFGKGAMWVILFALVYFVYMLVNQLTSSLIPGLGAIISLLVGILISPPLFAGYLTGAKALDEGDQQPFGRFFDGFKTFGHLVLMNLVRGILIFLVSILALLPIIVKLIELDWMAMFSGEMSQQEMLDTLTEFARGFSGFDVLLVFVLMLPSLYLTAIWVLAPCFVTLGKTDFWTGMELSRKLVSKKLISMLLLGLVWVLIVTASAFTILGLLITIPAMQFSLYLIFKDAIGTTLEEDMDVSDHLIAEE